MTEYMLLAASTLASEDFACISAGLLVANGGVSFAAAAFPASPEFCWGILVSLQLAGLPAGPFWRLATPAALARASVWLEKRGAIVILLSRFTPGLRLPAYLSAGISRAPFLPLLTGFVIACALWTPLLVGGSLLPGAATLGKMWLVTPALFTAWFLLTRNRAAWHKIRHWEFWPAWIAYLPLVPYLGFLAMKHRSLTLFTAANPGIEGGGLAGESKSRILRHLGAAEEFLPGFRMLRGGFDAQHLEFPVVLKPDVGERGRGVAIIRNTEQLLAYVSNAEGEVIMQDYVPGEEFGIFYYRMPGDARGRILSINAKVMPQVIGDGVSTLRELIDADARAFCMATEYLKGRNRDAVPACNERVSLVEIGSHCRGAIFLDAAHLATDALLDSIEFVSRHHPGFYFGRFDVRSESAATLQQGRFKVLELNGVAAEAAHIYDPAVGLPEAYRSLCRQWRIAFAIGARNRAAGFAPATCGELIRLLAGKRQAFRTEPRQPLPDNA